MEQYLKKLTAWIDPTNTPEDIDYSTNFLKRCRFVVDPKPTLSTALVINGKIDSPWLNDIDRIRQGFGAVALYPSDLRELIPTPPEKLHDHFCRKWLIDGMETLLMQNIFEIRWPLLQFVQDSVNINRMPSTGFLGVQLTLMARELLNLG